MKTQSVVTETLNDYFGIKNTEDQDFYTEFKVLTFECNDLTDFMEGAEEGTCWTDEDGQQYFKIRNSHDDCEVFYFLNDDIRKL